MTKKVPEFKSDREAEDFLEQDLTDYIDLKNFSQISFEFLPNPYVNRLMWLVFNIIDFRENIRVNAIKVKISP